MSAGARYPGPLFAPLRHWLAQLPDAPATAGLNALLARHPVSGEHGEPIRFVPPAADGLAYECRIWTQGAVETRPDNWHDFFNALVWLTFPQAKRAITAAHVAAMAPAGAARGTVRDALTHFDECGVVVLSTQPELLDLLRGHCWQELFVARRAAVRACMRFVVFGHATYESLLQPFRGLTAKAVLYTVEDSWLGLSDAALNAALDARLAADFAAGLHTRPRALQPVPLLGIPSVTPDSENPAYYADTGQFRPARRIAA
ncbi:MAG TPA: DUF3025 domain-containing protein [Azonexus sp.]